MTNFWNGNTNGKSVWGTPFTPNWNNSNTVNSNSTWGQGFLGGGGGGWQNNTNQKPMDIKSVTPKAPITPQQNLSPSFGTPSGAGFQNYMNAQNQPQHPPWFSETLNSNPFIQAVPMRRF